MAHAGGAPGDRSHPTGEARLTRAAGTILYLTRGEVTSLLPPLETQVDLVEEAYRELAAGRVELPPKPGVHPRPDSLVHAMPAYLERRDVVALKWVAGYRANAAKGLPYISGLIVLNDPETGVPIAVMEGAEITAARTAAASGACVRRFAPGWENAAIIGCGEQGRFHAKLLHETNPTGRIRAWDPHPDRVEALGAEPAATPQEAVAGADLVVTGAPIVDRPEPWLDAAELGERWLVLPIDFDALVRPELVADAELFLVDDVSQFEYYGSLGRFSGWPGPAGTVGGALDRDDAPARVICCNLGVAALDAIFAASVLEAARERGVGTALSR